MSQIPEEIVARVRGEANIVDVVGDYVRLRRSGKNWTGLCPFHEDKRPSFAVEPVRGIYKCFSCGEGGNVFTFLMKINGWSFVEAVRHLAGQLGVEIPEKKEDRKEFGERERLLAVVTDAARRYYKMLLSPKGEPALAYFRGRGFSDETIREFGLGYAPDEWEWLFGELTAAGYEAAEIEKAGLAIKRTERSGWYDRFRGRAMFPVFSATGRLVGFGARRMSEDPNQPKYLNSPETPVYNKSRLLYGLFQAKDAIRKEGYAVMVEGYADVISLHQAGVRTAVATCGTSLAREHADLVARYTNRVVLVYDSDAAGLKATERGIDVLIAGGIDVSVARLPDGEDPDTFVRNYGADEFRSRIDGARSFIEFLARTMKLRGDFDSPERQTDAIRALVKTVSLVPDRLKRELFVNKLAVDFHVDERLMLREMERALGKGEPVRRLPTLPPEPPIDADLSAASPSADAPPKPEQLPLVRKERPLRAEDLPPAELRLVKVLADGDPMMLEYIFDNDWLSAEDFTHPALRSFVTLILARYLDQRSFAIEDLNLEELPTALQELIGLLAVERETVSDYWRENDPEFKDPSPWKIARDCLMRMKQEQIEAEYRSMQEKLNAGELEEDEGKEVFEHLVELGNQRKRLIDMMRGETAASEAGK